MAKNQEPVLGCFLMWFKPLITTSEPTPVANLANSANYPPDIGSTPPAISRISVISNEVLSENKKPDLSGLAELAELAAPLPNELTISCGKCQHFNSHNQHGRGAGYCLIGGAFGSWSESPHQCTQFDAAVKWVELPDPKPDALTVTCYTPNGKPIKVQARYPEHASYLIRTNPKPQDLNK